MAIYDYSAYTSEGKKTKGQVDAGSAKAARDDIRKKGLMPIEVGLAETEITTRSGLFKKKLSASVLSLCIREVYTLLDAGTQLAEALRAMQDYQEDKKLKGFIAGIYQKVLEGASLARAIELSEFKVSQGIIAAIKAGEESGYLTEVLSQLSESVEKNHALQKELQGALIYPLIMLISVFGVLTFLMMYVVPKLIEVFSSMGQELPPLTQFIVDLSGFLQANSSILPLGLVTLTLSVLLLLKNKEFRYVVHKLILNIPVLKRLVVHGESAKWSRSLAILLQSGVNIEKSLKISSEVVSNDYFRNKAQGLSEQVVEGGTLFKSMLKSGIFPPLLLNLVHTGEGKGKLDEMLFKSAEIYEDKVRLSTKALFTVLEPLIVIFMGGLVLTIVLAVMLPIFDMNQMVGF